jgi:hypothetical protein
MGQKVDHSIREANSSEKSTSRANTSNQEGGNGHFGARNDAETLLARNDNERRKPRVCIPKYAF